MTARKLPPRMAEPTFHPSAQIAPDATVRSGAVVGANVRIGPRSVIGHGVVLHEDTVVGADVTVFDHALTRPWTVMKTYRRSAEARPQWEEYMCVWESKTVRIGDETYLLDKDGFLRPAKKDQPPPSLKYFPATQK